MWNLPRSEIEPLSPALAGGFLTTPGKSSGDHCRWFSLSVSCVCIDNHVTWKGTGCFHITVPEMCSRLGLGLLGGHTLGRGDLEGGSWSPSATPPSSFPVLPRELWKQKEKLRVITSISAYQTTEKRLFQEKIKLQSKHVVGNFPGSPMVKTSPSNGAGTGSIPGWRAKMPRASRPKNQNRRQKQYCNKLNKDLKNGPHQK